MTCLIYRHFCFAHLLSNIKLITFLSQYAPEKVVKKEKKKSGWFSWLTGEPEEVVSVELDTEADSASKSLHSSLK